MKKIGIIGRGFVGSAVEFGFSEQTGCDAIVKVYDKNTKFMHARKSIRLFFCIYRDFNPTSPYT